jgi:phosphoribosylformimino-5-aminoimidazole carboxamide ribotide isomerase
VRRWNPGEVAMLIPSIDLMGGKIVQLVQGKRKALEFSNLEEWIARFAAYPLVQLIDLDAAMGAGDNQTLVREFSRKLPCQVGGGIRSTQAAESLLSTGARRVIIGSALVQNGGPNTDFAQELAHAVGHDKLVFAVDSNRGRVAVHGWREMTALTPERMITVLEPWCEAFLYTHIDTEGLMEGMPLDVVRRLRQCTARQLIVAGGISTEQQVAELNSINVDCVVGMAIYTGKMKLLTRAAASKESAGEFPARPPHLEPEV